jgi:hypothetical protein
VIDNKAKEDVTMEMKAKISFGEREKRKILRRRQINWESDKNNGIVDGQHSHKYKHQ